MRFKFIIRNVDWYCFYRDVICVVQDYIREAPQSGYSISMFSLYNSSNELIYQVEADGFVRGQPKIYKEGFLILKRDIVSYLNVEELRLEDVYVIDKNSRYSYKGDEVFVKEIRDENSDSRSRVFVEERKDEWKVPNDFILSLNFEILTSYHRDEKNNTNWTKLSRLSFENGDILWTFNLEDHLEKLVSKYPFDKKNKASVLGVYKDQLWMSMKNGGLICLHKDSGEWMHYLRDCEDNTEPAANDNGRYPVITHTQHANIVVEEGKMICFYRWYYWELDLNSLEMDFTIVKEEVLEKGVMNIQTKPLALVDRQIIVVDRNSRKIAAFNRDSKKYDWIEDMPDDIIGAPRTVERHEDRCYVYTDKRELLVYEQEKSEA